MEAIFLIRQLMKRYREQKKDMHMIFIDLKNAYDKVSRNIMWWTLYHCMGLNHVHLLGTG
jgi:hypothetical protein